MDAVSESQFLEALPDSLAAWRALPNGTLPEWVSVWERLRPFFFSRGYDLFRTEEGKYPEPNTSDPPSPDSFGLYGDRGEAFREYSDLNPVVLGARDKMNRSVIIKLVAKGPEGQIELDILRLLNSEPLRSDPANSTVPVLEFVELGDWVFAVMPFCGGCDRPGMLNANECLEFSEQLLSTLSFMHEHRIAHRDIACENVLMNHYGERPADCIIEDNKSVLADVVEFRSTFPVRYMVIDFGCSLRFLKHLPLSSCVADRFPDDLGRPYMAIEAAYRRHDPFAADVYQAGRLLYSWFYRVAHNTGVPDYYELLRDMTAIYPPARPSMADSLARLRQLRARVSDEVLFAQGVPMDAPACWPMIEPPFWTALFAHFKAGLWHASYVYIKDKCIVWTGNFLRWIGIPSRFLPRLFSRVRVDFTVRRSPADILASLNLL